MCILYSLVGHASITKHVRHLFLEEAVLFAVEQLFLPGAHKGSYKERYHVGNQATDDHCFDRDNSICPRWLETQELVHLGAVFVPRPNHREL
jgi:hypothetical protein